jgi:hypothetical protein
VRPPPSAARLEPARKSSVPSLRPQPRLPLPAQVDRQRLEHRLPLRTQEFQRLLQFHPILPSFPFLVRESLQPDEPAQHFQVLSLMRFRPAGALLQQGLFGLLQRAARVGQSLKLFARFERKVPSAYEGEARATRWRSRNSRSKMAHAVASVARSSSSLSSVHFLTSAQSSSHSWSMAAMPAPKPGVQGTCEAVPSPRLRAFHEIRPCLRPEACFLPGGLVTVVSRGSHPTRS